MNIRGKQNSIIHLPDRFMSAAAQLTIIFTLIALFGLENAYAATLRIVSPPNNSFVTEEQVNISGTVSDETVKEISVSGVKTSAAKDSLSVEAGAFGTILSLKKGENSVKITSGNDNVTLKIYYQPVDKDKQAQKPPTGFTRFYTHENPTEMDCKECHKFRRGNYDFKRNVPAKSNCTIVKCHSKIGTTEPKVHGPVGAGVCISCHNPHGSQNRFQLQRLGADLCLICHMVKKEEFNLEVVHKPVQEGCTVCHDPHESKMQFQLRGDGKSVSSLCYNCHEKRSFTKGHSHGPVGAGDCIACHKPHASPNRGLLIAPIAKGEVCFQCHKDRKEEFTMKQVHAPVEDDCGKCHDPHSSESRFQLIKPSGQLCNSCHESLNPKVFEDIKTAQFKHQPVDEGRCADCHRVHSSNYKPLLKDSMEKLCLSCHVELGDEISESQFKHGPVQTGDCTACHKSHGSQFTKLLSRYFPMNFYSEYNPDYYDLCFGCHNKDIAKKKFTTTLTNFRDGKYNLHYFHVNMKKGRTCTSCHDAHASSQPKHIRYEVPFGSWSYPINFTKSNVGGTCVVGCHAPKTYDRKQPKIKQAN
ncbi:MAG: cytochrome c3 family protein [Proteobacteria bacterium]|nr:cytochrome c3 family protein [Pseudomonadota bacterium]